MPNIKQTKPGEPFIPVIQRQSETITTLLTALLTAKPVVEAARGKGAQRREQIEAAITKATKGESK